MKLRVNGDEREVEAGPAAIANAIRRASGFRALRLPISFADITANSAQ
jgi:CO/xanthine dehydrogenase Mo-binding subunit